VRACVRVGGSGLDKRARVAILLAASLAPPHFSTLSHKRNDFRKKRY
jgi:hypothetical protein